MKRCKLCGAEIEDRTSHNTKYCSSKCAREAEARQNIKRIADRANHLKGVNHLVYRAYNYKCAICGWKATDELIISKGKIQYAYGNEVHHITQVAKGGKETADNLILLCPNHHKQADLGLLNADELRAFTVPFDITPEERATAKAECADAIADLIFTDG